MYFNLGNFYTTILGLIVRCITSETTMFFKKGDRKVDAGFKLTSVPYAKDENDGITKRVL